MTERIEGPPGFSALSYLITNHILLGTDIPEGTQVNALTYHDVAKALLHISEAEQYQWIIKQMKLEQEEMSDPASSPDLLISRTSLSAQRKPIYERFVRINDAAFRFFIEVAKNNKGLKSQKLLDKSRSD